MSAWSMCALTEDVVLLACVSEGVGAFTLSTQHYSTLINTSREVWGVAFDALTDTLLLLQPSSNYNDSFLVSMRRDKSDKDKWIEVDSVRTGVTVLSYEALPDIAVCNSLVFLGNGGETLYVIEVNKEHRLLDRSFVNIPGKKFYKLACSRLGNSNDTRVAFACADKSVSLWLLKSVTPLVLRFERVWHFEVTDPRRLLFRGDQQLLLAVKYTTDSHLIKLLQITGSEEASTIAVEHKESGVSIGAWSLAGDRLVIWDMKSSDPQAFEFLNAYEFA